MLRKRTHTRQCGRAHGDHRVILYAPRVIPFPKSGTPHNKLLYSLHVPEVAEFNPKGVIQSSSSVSCPCLRGKHCPVRTLVAYLLCLQKPSYFTRPRVHLETWFWLHKMQILFYRTYPKMEYFQSQLNNWLVYYTMKCTISEVNSWIIAWKYARYQLMITLSIQVPLLG